MAIITCPRCEGTMESGFILDRAHQGRPSEQQWVEDEPIKGFARAADAVV